jgi:hypothetical protein
MRQESWHTSAFRLESRLSPSWSVQNIIASSMGPSGEGLAIGGALTGRRAEVDGAGLHVERRGFRIPFTAVMRRFDTTRSASMTSYCGWIKRRRHSDSEEDNQQ